MTKGPINRRLVARAGALAILLGGLSAAPALAKDSSSSAASNCSTPTLTQPFLGYGDQNWYALAPGESADNFDGTGWTLNGGASIQTQQLADGSSGSVLDLPSEATAVSPPICVQSDYPTARTLDRSFGLANLAVGVSYADQPGSPPLGLSGLVPLGNSSWSPSGDLQVHPGNRSGWQLVRFIFANVGALGDAQLYNFYIDPRMRR
jgi:hypothetical protein